MTNYFELFDKIINLYFFDSNKVQISSVLTPSTGIKPDISVTGNFLPMSTMSQVDVKIVNFYPNVPLSQFKYMTIEAGYSGKILTAIQGEVSVAFQESPSPDGITHFQMLTGSITDAINIQYVIFYPEKTALNKILSDMAFTLGVENKSYISDSILTTSGVYNNGTINDFIQKLSKAFDVIIKIDGPFLITYERNGKTNISHDIVFFNGPPKKDAGKLTFQSPWLPNLRTGDVININPQFMRETFGGAQNTFGSNLSCLNYTFEFGTVSDQNQMTVTCTEFA